MKTNELIKRWKAEEEIAHIHGWDFSHIEGRYMEEDDLPWDYREEILRYLKPDMRILDIDTGGGEFLLSLNHPNENTAATENYPPNVDLCQETLLPLGIEFRAADGKGVLPFVDVSFDMVIKLKKKASRFDRVSLDRRCYVPNRVRSDNNSIFYHLDDLHAAIANDWRITFKYFYFTPKKQKACGSRCEATADIERCGHL